MNSPGGSCIHYNPQVLKLLLTPMTQLKKKPKNSRKPVKGGPKKGKTTGKLQSIKDAGFTKYDVLPRRVNPPPRVGGVTKDGADWLVQALDPFHDSPRAIEGYPDMDSSNTVTSKLSYSMTISAPAAVVWDCHIFTLPTLVSQLLTNVAFGTAGALVTQTAGVGAAASFNVGFLNAISAASGSGLFPTDVAWNPANLATNVLPSAADSSDAMDGFSRVIAAGFEIVNITPELTKGGLITVYKQPQHIGTTTLKVVDATAGNLVDGGAQYRVVKSMPATVSEALRMPHCEQWSAKEGAYVVCPFNDMNNPMRTQDNTPYVIENDGVVVSGKWALGERALGGAAVTHPTWGGQQYVPMDSVGVFATGLSPETVLQVRLIIEYEKAPTHFDDSVKYATISPCYDVGAMQSYAAVVRTMPVGTPLKNNWGGAWFKMILSKIRKFVGPIAGVFGASKAVDNIHDGAHDVITGISKIFPMLP